MDAIIIYRTGAIHIRGDILAKGYTSVSVPNEIVAKARNVLDVGGYTSVGELIRDAVRRRIEIIESEINKKRTKKTNNPNGSLDRFTS